MSGLTGRFLTRDPSLYDGSPFDLYEYCESNPFKYTDPSGKNPVLILVLALVSCLGLSSNAGYQFFGDDEHMRHCYASCVGAKNCGAILTALAGYDFEVVTLTWDLVTGQDTPTNHWNHYTDLFNNGKGILCAGIRGVVSGPGPCGYAYDFGWWLAGYGCAKCCERSR